MWEGGAFIGFWVDLAPIREALDAIEITGQITIQWLVTRLVPTPQWSTGGGNYFDRILFSLWSELCLPLSSLSSAQSTNGQGGKETSQILYQRTSCHSLSCPHAFLNARPSLVVFLLWLSNLGWLCSGWTFALENEDHWHAPSQGRLLTTFSEIPCFKSRCIHGCSWCLWLSHLHRYICF